MRVRLHLFPHDAPSICLCKFGGGVGKTSERRGPFAWDSRGSARVLAAWRLQGKITVVFSRQHGLKSMIWSGCLLGCLLAKMKKSTKILIFYQQAPAQAPAQNRAFQTGCRQKSPLRHSLLRRSYKHPLLGVLGVSLATRGGITSKFDAHAGRPCVPSAHCARGLSSLISFTSVYVFLCSAASLHPFA